MNDWKFFNMIKESGQSQCSSLSIKHTLSRFVGQFIQKGLNENGR